METFDAETVKKFADRVALHTVPIQGLYDFCKENGATSEESIGLVAHYFCLILKDLDTDLDLVKRLQIFTLTAAHLGGKIMDERMSDSSSDSSDQQI